MFSSNASSSMRKQHCIFCNSKTHTTMSCNSNFGGKRTDIDSRLFMLEDICPDFYKYKLNELRYIACTKAVYEKANPNSMIYFWDKLGREYNRKYIRNPIPITLSKRQLIIALEKRWRGFAPVRLIQMTPPECDTCPICMEVELNSPPIFSPEHSEWECSDWVEDVNPIDGAAYNTCRGDRIVITPCKHKFCARCFIGHANTNRKEERYISNRWVNSPHVACPMCRTHITL